VLWGWVLQLPPVAPGQLPHQAEGLVAPWYSQPEPSRAIKLFCRILTQRLLCESALLTQEFLGFLRRLLLYLLTGHAKRACGMFIPAASSGFEWETHEKGPRLRILVAITGASGALYAQRLLDNLDPRHHEIHVVLSNYAQAVIAEELPHGLRLPEGVKSHGLKSMNVPFASGSNPFDAMVVIPCSMGTLGRIAHGLSEDVLLRAADVMLKERKKLILVPRETPLNLVHIKNLELLTLAGAIILPANPSFYTRPQTIEQVVDTVVARVLDHMGISQNLVQRWQEEKE
jgi:4-hydroxy-3-polyprenylbenzoate decarboxylase